METLILRLWGLMRKHSYNSLKVKYLAISSLIIKFILNISSNKECKQQFSPQTILTISVHASELWKMGEKHTLWLIATMLQLSQLTSSGYHKEFEFKQNLRCSYCFALSKETKGLVKMCVLWSYIYLMDIWLIK